MDMREQELEKKISRIVAKLLNNQVDQAFIELDAALDQYGQGPRLDLVRATALIFGVIDGVIKQTASFSEARMTLNRIAAVPHECERPVSSCPDCFTHILVHTSLGLLADDLGAYEEALLHLGEALAKSQDDIIIRFYRGMIRGDIGEYRSALDDLRAAKALLDHVPNDTVYIYKIYRDIIAAAPKDVAERITYLEKNRLINAFYTNIPSFAGLSRVTEEGDLPGGVVPVSKLLTDIDLMIGVTWMYLEDLSEARKYFRDIRDRGYSVENGASYASALLESARAALMLNHLNTAHKELRDLSEVPEAEQFRGQIHSLQGAVYYHLGKYELALEEYTQALQWSPDDQDRIDMERHVQNTREGIARATEMIEKQSN